jgi:phosphatidylinositol alpha-1,6-mannosyltransferase
LNKNVSVVGLFPEFRNGHLGGIQASASTAWAAVSAKTDVSLLCYEKSPSNGNSRVHAIFAAVKQTNPADILLAWQVGLLKLLPFFRTRPRRVVLFLHGIEVWKEQDWLTQRLLKRVDLFLTNSDYTWERFLSHYPELGGGCQQTVWLGLEAPLTADPGPPNAVPKAMMLSRLSQTEDYKGHRELINAWLSVVNRIPTAQLLIAGEGDLRTELEQLVEKNNLTASVRFLGRISESEKQQFLKGSRCLLMPSRAEGFGLVYLEAMRLGRPCLVSTLDAGREVVNPPEAGLAANLNDKAELADAVCRLLSEGPQWRRWSEQARKRYEENYTAKHFQERLLAALFQDRVPVAMQNQNRER